MIIPDRTFIFTVDGRELETSRTELTAGQIREMAGVPASYLLLVRGASPAEDRELSDTERVSLAPAVVEHLVTREPGNAEDVVRYRLQVDDHIYDRFERTISGAAIKRIANLPTSAQILQEPGRRPVADVDVVNLARAGTERFVSQAAPALTVTIRAPNGASQPFPYDPDDTVAALLARAVAAFAALGQLNPGEAFNLAFDARILDGASTLAAAGVRADAVLSLRSARVPGDG